MCTRVYHLLLIAATFLQSDAASLSSNYASVASYCRGSSDCAVTASSSSTDPRLGPRRSRYTHYPSSLPRRRSRHGSFDRDICLTSAKTSRRQESRRRWNRDDDAASSSSDDGDAAAWPGSSRPNPQITYQDLSPFGKLVAGTVEVCFATILEYMTGFSAGYLIGVVTDVPRLLFRSLTTPEGQEEITRTFWQEFTGRTARMNAKSFKWAKK